MDTSNSGVRKLSGRFGKTASALIVTRVSPSRVRVSCAAHPATCVELDTHTASATGSVTMEVDGSDTKPPVFSVNVSKDRKTFSITDSNHFGFNLTIVFIETQE